MLLILFGWFLISVSTCAIGWLWWRMWAGFGLSGQIPPLEILSLGGIATLTIVLQPLSLFAPINNWARYCVVGVTVGTLLWQHRAIGIVIQRAVVWPRSNKTAFALLLLLGIALLIRCGTYMHNHDAQLYYIQAMQWIEQYPVVPGLGNLHGRLAFNISLFLPTTLYKISTPNGAYYGLPTYFYLLLLLTAIRGISNALRQQHTTWWPWVCGVVYVSLTHLVGSWISSPAPDCALAVLLALLFFHYTQQSKSQQGRLSDQDIVLFLLLICVAVTVKLSALPVLLLLLAIALRHRKQFSARQIVAIALLTIVIWVPWFVRSLYLSGYLVYPLPVPDLFRLDWKVSAEQVQLERSLIINMARYTEAAVRQQVPQPLFTMWLPRWWNHYRNASAVVPLLLLVALSPFLMAFYLYKHRAAKRLPEHGVWAVWLTAFAGCIFWLAAAPDYRFGIGFLLVAGLWPVLSLLSSYQLNRKASVIAVMLLVCWSLQSLRDTFYQLRTRSPVLYTHVVWPAIESRPPTTNLLVENRVVHIAQVKGACGNTPVPCTYQIALGLQFRGATLAEGFRVSGPSTE